MKLKIIIKEVENKSGKIDKEKEKISNWVLSQDIEPRKTVLCLFGSL